MGTKRVLVAFGSRMGGTEGLARAVGEALAQTGHEVEVRPAHEIDGLEAWDAVVVGGALYMNRWQRGARRFVQSHRDELRQMPVWFFSSGPLDDSASKGEIAPTAQVRKLMDQVQARGHVTFGGRLAPDARGLIARPMVKQGRAGDWRDLEGAGNWARSVAGEIDLVAPRRAGQAVEQAPGKRRARRLLGALCLFTGLTAIGGGVELMRWPEGPPWAPGLEVSLLRHSPFSDFFIPGLLLFAVVGLGNLAAGVLALRRHRRSELFAFAAGAALVVWIVTEVVMLRALPALAVFYLAVGLATMVAALWLWRRHRAALRLHVPEVTRIREYRHA